MRQRDASAGIRSDCVCVHLRRVHLIAVDGAESVVCGRDNSENVPMNLLQQPEGQPEQQPNGQLRDRETCRNEEQVELDKMTKGQCVGTGRSGMVGVSENLL